MSLEGKNNPRNQKVLLQLDRILASQQFKKSATQSKLLKFVVKKALLKTDLQEADIFIELYGDVAIKTHKVRAGACIVRDKLEKYYENHGGNDLIKIDLPLGPPYTAVFTYSDHSEVIRNLNRATVLLQNISSGSLYNAACIIANGPPETLDFALSIEKYFEICLLTNLWDCLFNARGNTLPEDEEREFLQEKLKQQRNSWRSQLMLGVVAAFNGNWKEANIRFESALYLNPREINTSLWYASYLITVGRIQEGLHIVDDQTGAHQESSSVLLAGMILYHLTREHKKAEECRRLCENMVTDNKLFHLLDALLKIEAGLYDRADISAMRITGLTAIAPKDNLHVFGLRVFSLVRDGDLMLAMDQFRRKRSQFPREPMQFALAYMAFGRNARALASLRRAQMQGNIFLNWLHLLPIFDPLRNHPRFQRIIVEYRSQFVSF